MSDNNQFSKQPQKKSFSQKNGRFGMIFFLLAAVVFIGYTFWGQRTIIPKITYTDFLSYVEEGRISEVRIIDNVKIQGSLKSVTGQNTLFETNIPYSDNTLMAFLEKNNVIVSGIESSPSFFVILTNFLPWIILLLFFLMIIRQNSAQSNKGLQFGKSKAHVFDNKKNKKIKFSDVAGQIEAKQELEEVVDFLKNPQKYEKMGAKIPTGVLLVGAPGTGKTLLARAVAGEADVSFLHISGSDFVEMFVGVGASRVRSLFEQGRKMAPAIIFIDEIDAVGRARGAGFGGGHDEREQTLNQMLVEMDGFETKDGVIVLAATNRPDVLDPALLRPGRFDRQVIISLPDIKEREEILKVHATKVKLANAVSLNKFARATPGMSGADLANMINEAALAAARKSIDFITDAEMEEARDKILMGVARESVIMPEKEKQMTACHESGHALQYYYLENASPLHKVTIIPRGRALGLTIGLPKEDSYSHTKKWLKDQLVILFGGYAAEKLVYDDTTTGAQNDIARATDIAHKMVTEWGMSDKVGAMAFGQDDEPIFMGKEIERKKGYSEYMARQIDESVKEILDEAKNRAYKNLEDHRDQLSKLSNLLFEKETLEDTEIRKLLGFSTRITSDDSIVSENGTGVVSPELS
ncbi:MAG: cell division protein FtsH [Treponema sp. CETP13]|nr:MAG: cell division protein FtsH [Treponema sp. CETP13]